MLPGPLDLLCEIPDVEPGSELQTDLLDNRGLPCIVERRRDHTNGNRLGHRGLLTGGVLEFRIPPSSQ